MYHWRETRVDDLFELAETMCAEDKREMKDCGYDSPLAALIRSFTYSHYTITALYDCKVVCVFGVVRYGHHGIVWMLTTGLNKHRKQLHKWAPMFFEKVSVGCKTLGNYLPVYQRSHIRWLKFYGFKPTANTAVRNGQAFIELVKEV